MLASISNFGNNAAGLEKVLRLAQALSTVGASLATTVEDESPWLLARRQFNLSRRFFRLHKWIDHFSLASEKFNNEQEENAMVKLLDVTRNGFLGTYFFMEMGTITNVMGLTSPSWGPNLLLESQKFWFYAITTSLLLSFYKLLFIPSSPSAKFSAAPVVNEKDTDTTKTERTTTSTKETTAQTPAQVQVQAGNTDLYRQILIDGCDLFIPGAVTGWIPIETLSVGVFMSISSVLAMGGMWPKIQASAAAARSK